MTITESKMMSDGSAVTAAPVHAELTTKQVLDLHHASRPHPVELLEGGGYQEARERASEQPMAELARQSQELGLGYE